MNISGSGHIAAGEYNEDISISGSGKIDGNVRCISLSCSGAASSAGDVYCSDKVKVSGSAHFGGNLSSAATSVSGSIHVDGDCTASDKIKISGGFKCGGNLKCTALSASGGMSVGHGIEAEEIFISGAVKCEGLMNAERIEIKIEKSSSYIGSIGGSSIKIYSKGGRAIKRLPLLSSLVGPDGLKVNESIEGDLIAIEDVTAPLVIGRVVAVGAGCRIDLVQYSEEIEIHPDAKVGKYEKI